MDVSDPSPNPSFFDTPLWDAMQVVAFTVFGVTLIVQAIGVAQKRKWLP